MSQFSVHENRNPDSRKQYPYLLDVQSPLLDTLETRIVVPLMPLAALQGNAMTTLMPSFTINGEPHVMLTPHMAGVSQRLLGTEITHLGSSRDSVIAAIDLLITGI